MARYKSPVVTDPNAAQKRQQALDQLEPIPGDAYAVKNELKALGAVWDAALQQWRIAPEKLMQARALVESQEQIPPPAAPTPPEELADPFEEGAEEAQYATLDKKDGDTYAARDALRAIGARWDGNRRSWLVREDRADYARAVVAYVTNADSASPLENDTAPAPETPTQTEAPFQPPTGAMKFGDLWPRKDKDGRQCLMGQFSPTVNIAIYRNDSRASADEPSHIMYLVPLDTDEEETYP